MKQKLLLALLALFTLGGGNLFAQTDVANTYITNADFSSTDGWTQSVSSSFKDIGNGLIGTYGVRTVEGQAVSTVDETHLATEYCFGFEARWESNFASYNQETKELPIGVYTLTFDVENTNAQTTKATYNNLFYVQVGEEKISDNSTEWMNGKSSWTTHTIQFTITEAAKATISLGYGTGSNNIGSKNTPTLHVSHLKLTWADPLAAAKDALQAEIDRAKLCDAKEGLADAIAAAEDALANATTAEELSAALAALQAADKDAVLRYENSLTDASATNGMETSFVVNGTFTDNVDGWSRTGGFQNSNRASNQSGDFTVPFWENWNPSAKENKMYQTINNIPNGTYKLKIAAFVNTLADPNESQFVFANNDKTYLTTGAPTFYEVWTVVSNNKVEIGLEQTTATANWMGIDNVSLTYYGAGDVIEEAQVGAHKTNWEEALAAARAAVVDETYANVIGAELTALNTEINKAEPTTADGYDEATAALTAATEAFIAAKPNYDALVAEIAKAKALGMEETTVNGYAATAETTSAIALTNTQNLKVAEYTYVSTNYAYGVELGTWTTEGPTGSLSDQHYKGSGYSYLEQSGAAWGQSSWTIKYNQDLALPAGKYVFKVAGRQAASDGVTLSLEVKNGETVLGTVSDFPKGDTGLGINTSGATDFTTGEGHEYVNGGAGRGWEWRYVQFELSADATVNVAVNAVATKEHMWVSFCDATVQTDNEANISLIEYNIALNNAKTTLANSDYENVTGEEKTALEDAIAADNTLDKTSKEAIEKATATLTEATATFTAAKAAYDAFVAAKTAETPELEYAAASKKDALTTAKATADATSAADAVTKTAAITKALRVYYESHALAEGVDGATNCTEKVKNNLFNDSDNNWTSSQSGGNKQVINTESFTDGDGNNNYNYYDYYNNDANNQNVSQTIEGLDPGIYILTVTARAATSLTDVRLYAGSAQIEIPRQGNSGQTFDRGWNDVTLKFVKTNSDPITIKVASNHSGGNHGGWFGFTRVRLVKLPTDELTLLDNATQAPEARSLANVTYARNLTAGYNSLVLPFEVTKEELGAVKRILEFVGSEPVGEDFKLNFKEVEKVEANKPYLVEMNAATTDGLNFISKVVAPAEDLSMGDDNFKFVGSYVALEKGNNVIKAGDYGCATTGLKKAKDGVAMKAFRAYMKNNTNNPEAEVRVFVDGEEATGIQAVEILESLTDGIYNLQGQKVNKAQKGVYIVNGKKVILK